MLTGVLVAELNVHPVKSTRPVRVPSAVVEPWGLAGDRRWMLVDPAGTRISARQEHRLLAVTTRLVPGGLVLGDLTVPEPEGPRIPVRTGKTDLLAVPAGPEANAWFARVLDRDDLRLVWCDDPTRRRLDPDYALDGDSTGFADAYPLLLATTGSLRQLRDWIAETAVGNGEPVPDPLPMSRFRPNVVIETEEPFDEDTWARIRIGDVTFRTPKPCDRCVMTTVSARTLRRGPEPIRTLARHRKWGGKTWFGVNAIPDGTGKIHVGDPVEVIERRGTDVSRHSPRSA